jgi:PAS domain S-box-containing protein
MPYKQMSREDLLAELEALAAKLLVLQGEPEKERDRLLNELRLHQVELEMQNRELREAQQLVEESRSLYADLFDFAPVGYLTFDNKGTIREINLAAAQLLGREREALIGQPFPHPDSREDQRAFKSHLWRCLDKNMKATTEIELSTFERGSITLEIASTPFSNPAGTVIGCRTVLTDVSERRRSEAALRFSAKVSAALASSLDYETTLKHVVELAVPELGDCCFIEGISDNGSITLLAEAHARPSGQNIAVRVSIPCPSDRDLLHGVRRVVETQRAEIYPMPSRLEIDPRLDAAHPQRLRALSARSYMCVPLNVGGRRLGAVTFAYVATRRSFDETHLLSAEDFVSRAAMALENARLYEVAQKAILFRQDVVSIVSHDLRNPLNALMLISSTLRADARENDRRRKQFEMMDRAVARMEHLIRDLLDMTRIESGHLSVDRAPRRVTNLLRDSMEMLEPVAAKASVQLGWGSSDPELSVLCDQERIAEVLSNLVGNAIKFTPKGGAITVRGEQDGDDVCFSITDTGVGLSREQLGHVFERYWQAATTARKGTGLGLFITKGIVEAHGGRIWAESEVGLGTTFYFTLPVCSERNFPDRPAKEWQALEALSPATSGLVVDDDPVLRDSLAMLFKSRGYRVVCAASGVEAMAHLADHPPPSFIVLDLGMPVMDGAELGAALKRDAKLSAVPVFVVSGADGLADKAAALGATGWFAKPVPSAALLDAIVHRLGASETSHPPPESAALERRVRSIE